MHMELSDIKGLGKKTEQILNKLKINNIRDLVEYYPYRFEHIVKSDIRNLQQDDLIVIDGVIESLPNRMTFKLNIGSQIINVSIFNRAFLKNKLLIGTEVTVIGKYDKLHNQINASDIRLERLQQETIEPVYHTTSGITGKQINSYINLALPFIEVEDYTSI